MTVKVFFTTILVLAAVSITGFASWLFPVVDNIHQQLGGQPLQDPRGSVSEQITIWLSFLPTNNVERTQIVCFIVAAYLLATSVITLAAVQMQRRRVRRTARDAARIVTMRRFSLRAAPAVWISRTAATRYSREAAAATAAEEQTPG